MERAWDILVVVTGDWYSFHRRAFLEALIDAMPLGSCLWVLNRPQDPSRIVRRKKIKPFMVQIRENIKLINAFLPIHDQISYHSPILEHLNFKLLQKQLRSFWLAERQKAIWIMHPSFSNYRYLGKFNQVIYDCYDEFIYLNRKNTSDIASKQLFDREKNLILHANLVILASPVVCERKKRDYGEFNDYLILNPASYSIFTPARHGRLQTPDDLDLIPQPRIAYIGGVKSLIDQQLVFDVAQAFPEASVVFIGPLSLGMDTSLWDNSSNIYLLGPKPYNSLPAYLSSVQVGIIPYGLDYYTETLTPCKAMEYVMAGLEVVSTAIPSLSGQHPEVIHLAHSSEEFIAYIESCLERYPYKLSDELLWANSLELEMRKLSDFLNNV